MSKQKSQIRWRESDSAELQRIINNFNRKIYRVRKNHPEIADIQPQTVNMTSIKEQIVTRADFNRIANSLERYTRRGAEQKAPSTRGRKATVGKDKEYSIKRRVYNRQKAKGLKELEEKEVTSRGKPTGKTRAEMGSVRVNALKPITSKPENKSQKEWEYHKKMLDRALNPLTRELDKYNMKMNYIKGLQNAGVSEDIIELVRQMDVDRFIEIVTTDEQAEFDFIYETEIYGYDSEGNPLRLMTFSEHEDALRQTWETALQKQNKTRG